MRCVVIDDEKPGLDLICSYVEKIPFLKMAGAFNDMAEALNFIVSNPVDLLMTDIELNADMNGIELIKSLPNPPAVIFISAYDRYAIEGYTLNAVDYLLKPVSLERFSKAINKAYAQWQRQHPSKPVPETLPPPSGQAAANAPEYIFIKTENRLVKIFLSEILFIKGFGDYVKIRLSDGRTILSLQTLNNLEATLPDTFARIHRSSIVAIGKIDEIERRRVRIGDEIIPIGENYLEAFLKKVMP